VSEHEELRRLTPEQIAERTEFTNRLMHRLHATARHGRQPTNQGEAFEIVIEKGAVSGKQTSVAFRVSDTEAVITEMLAGLPCGICHQNPCTYHLGPQS
jgi:hypothetical protein